MNAISKIDLLYKYGTPRKVVVPVSEAERKESKLAGRERTHKTIEVLPDFCKAGDMLEILSDRPGAWRVIVICKNRAGQTLPVLWTDLLTELDA